MKMRWCGLMAGWTMMVAAGSVRAADSGDPVLPVDLAGKARAEIIYEARDRELDDGGTFEADVFTLRAHTEVGEYAYLDFDLGGINPSGGDLEFYGGLGLRYIAYEGVAFRLSPFVQFHYAPALEVDGVKYDDLFDVDAGLLLAGKWRIDDQLSIMPYAGPVVSLVRLNGDNDASEDQSFVAVAGISLLMPGHNTFRVEAQLTGNPGFSVAAGIAF